MKIHETLRPGEPSFSFEFFPPKDDAGFEQLYKTIQVLKPLHPTYVSVTYGAGGSTRSKTIQLVERIKNEIGIESMAHLTCVGATRDEIAAVLDDLAAAGVDNVLALRGDPPRGEQSFVPRAGGLAHASELIELIRARHDFCIGAACYPEVHPEATSADADLEHLKRKVDAGADFLITQLFFDNADFLRFRDRCRKAGIDRPIIAGIMPIQSVGQIKRFTQMCGTKIPGPLLRRIEAVEDDVDSVRHIGMFHSTEQCRELLREGVAGIHFYTLNRSTATRAIFQYLRKV
jgi:methylenetetrahydrofolate reductase (NADPH)